MWTRWTASPWTASRRWNRCIAKAGDQYPVIGWVEGVLAELADLRGVNELLEDLADEAEYLEEAMTRLLEGQCRFAKAQVDAGADFIGVGNAVASLVGPALYAEYAMPWDKRLVSYIHGLGAKVKLHICGNTGPLLTLIRDEWPRTSWISTGWWISKRRSKLSMVPPPPSTATWTRWPSCCRATKSR